MNKAELTTAIAEKTGLAKKDVEAVVRGFTDVVTATLAKGESVTLVGFGSFMVTTRAARAGRNPQTGTVLKIAARRAPKFKAGKALKDAVEVRVRKGPPGKAKKK